MVSSNVIVVRSPFLVARLCSVSRVFKFLPDDHTRQTTDTPGFKPFTIVQESSTVCSLEGDDLSFQIYMETCTGCLFIFEGRSMLLVTVG